MLRRFLDELKEIIDWLDSISYGNIPVSILPLAGICFVFMGITDLLQSRLLDKGINRFF